MNDDCLLLLKLLGRDFRDNWPFWRKKFKASLTKWRNRFLADLSKLIVLALCVWGGYVVFLYYLQSIWVVFAETPMGKIFATQVSPEIVGAIASILDLELSQVALNCVINILLITVPVGILLKFSGLYRLAYLNRGFIGGIFWGIVCTTASAELLPIVGSSVYPKGNAAIYFLPTICLLAGSFGLSAWLVPEFTVVFEFVEFLRERVQIIKIRDLPYDSQDI
jgi:hypothetical protein